ncbi:helix-turn-helix domain-containing protein [Planococcus sp. 107-1]|uniref:helix-turn-helix domain-containing protein n=1 Tax=Planococcus sp. 107-1 TaxID=2908840 RepID=UPI001F21A122|nr:helix-turn-helix transcriptional regulator [Planococcus sp. 107-1]UJF27415.1 helix-turn-helix domain-containing protein [Planococcus sp. 107-1]
METLGERIKKLRKEQGLTLQTLAGSGLTKGMLSLIENNKANPSMESLSYIAEQLGIDKDELLAEIPTSELRELLQDVEKMYRAETENYSDGFIQIAEKIEPYVASLPYRYESARLLEIYSRSLYYAKKEGWQSSLSQAEEMYEGLHLMNNSAEIHMFRAMLKFNEHLYSDALSMLQESRKSFEARDAVLDSLKKLDFDFVEAILYFAIGNDEDAVRIIDEAVEYSKEHQIFYKMNDLYRVMSFHAILKNNQDMKNYYVHKLRLFAEFSDDEKIDITLDLLEAHYLNSFAHEYEKAEAIVDKNLEKYKEDEISQFFLEKGKALYGQGRLEEALDWLKRHKIWEFLHHPYDLAMNYEKDAYIALIYEQQGQHELAVKHADIAKNNVLPMLDLPYKKFILDVHQQIVR